MRNNSGKYILYGTGLEAEYFIYQNYDIIDNIAFCIDAKHTGNFHNIPIFKIEEIDNMELLMSKKIIVAGGEYSTYCNMCDTLVKKQLKEFANFTWSKAFGKKLAVINANCHGEAVVRYLQQSDEFCDQYFVYPLPPIQENLEIPPELLSEADLYIHQDIRPDNKISYKLSDEYTLSKLKKDCLCICIPNFVGMGGWMFPALGGLDKVVKMMKGTMYILYRDYVLESFEREQDINSYIKLWTEYKFDGKELDQKWNDCFECLRKREKNWDIKITEFILNNCKTIPCFVDANHPSKYVMKEIGRQIAKIIGLDDIVDDEKYESALGIQIPIMPDVIEHFNLRFVAPPEKQKAYLGKKVTDEIIDYIRAYFWWYQDRILL